MKHWLWLLSIGLTACSGAVEPLDRYYYHWQTTLSPDSAALARLADTERLYVKAFDVVWGGAAVPAAELIRSGSRPLPQLVPVIFLTNEVMLNTRPGDVSVLANRISNLVEELFPEGYPEIQVDCDWTARTQVQYFELLAAMRSRNEGRDVTCTVRLHQYRDRATQGVPPVPRATLMAYNTGDLDDWATENSIVDTSVLDAYLADQSPYPIPLDIAVAVYDWAAVYRRGKLAHLINEPSLGQLSDTLLFAPIHGTRYRAKTTTYLDGILLYEGDLLRYEIAAPGRIADEADRIRGHIGHFPGQRLMIYRLGSRLWG